ncbi:alpha/beta hydrolase [Bacillus sp. FJAT-49736]|nr:alpha/beta hydrolase [Bacillus sp. FJAT-49736]
MINNEKDYFSTYYFHGLHVSIIGEGEPIIFLHGGPGGEHRFFLPHLLPLAKQFKLVFYDQRGCGKSKPSENNQYTIQEEVKALEMLRVELQLEKINLVGESWGSMLALLYAATYPDRVNKILLTAAIGITAEGFNIFAKELDKKLTEKDKAQLSYWAQILENDESALVEIFKIIDKYYVYSEETLKRKSKTQSNSTVNAEMGKDIQANYNLSNHVTKLKDIPILVAQGSHDILHPGLIQNLLLDHIPHAELVVIEQCGHWTVVEKPEVFIDITQKFFGTH